MFYAENDSSRQVPGPCQRAEKVEEHKAERHINCSRKRWNILYELRKKKRDYPDHSTAKIQ